MSLLDSPVEVRKIVRQFRRAQALAQVVATIWPTPAWAHNAAGQFDADQWAIAAQCAGIDPPSDDTIALAVELLRQEAEQ